MEGHPRLICHVLAKRPHCAGSLLEAAMPHADARAEGCDSPIGLTAAGAEATRPSHHQRQKFVGRTGHRSKVASLSFFDPLFIEPRNIPHGQPRGPGAAAACGHTPRSRALHPVTLDRTGRRASPIDTQAGSCFIPDFRLRVGEQIGPQTVLSALWTRSGAQPVRQGANQSDGTAPLLQLE